MKEALVVIDGMIDMEGIDFASWSLIPDTYTQVAQQLEAQRPFTQIKLAIDSPGGYVHIGRKIGMLLSSQNVPITTVAGSQCMSIAAELFALGQNRQIIIGSDFMIHKPHGGTYGNEDEIASYLESLRNATSHMINVFSAVTGRSEAEVREWMVRDKSMTAEQAVANGFATEIIYTWPFKKPESQQAMASNRREPIMAFNSDTPMDNKALLALGNTMASIKQGIDNVLAKLSPARTQALALTLNDGREVAVETNENAPQLGDAIKIAGEKPENGDYTLSDNQIITVADGKISDIKAPEQQETTENPVVNAEQEAQIAALKQENQALKAQLQAEKQALLAQKSEFETQFQALNTQLETVAKATHSTYNPESRKFEGKTDATAEDERVAKSKAWAEKAKAEAKSNKK